MSQATVRASKLTAIEVLNFMLISNARVEFDETGIINFVGYNDSGKSTMTRAIEVVLYDAYSTDQVNMIQDDKDLFGVGLEFDDGVEINKYKYRDGKSVWEMKKDGEVIFTNRLDAGIAAMHGVPDPIAKYLNVVKDDATNEKLNIRRNTDKLFLINTTGGDNYKILNSVLKTDILSEAVSRLNADRNKLQSEVVNASSTVSALESELKEIVVLNDDGMGMLKQSSEKLRDTMLRREYISEVSNKLQKLSDIVVYEELKPVDTERFAMISDILQSKERTNIVVQPECKEVDNSRVQLLQQIAELQPRIAIEVQPELQLVDDSRLEMVKAIGEAYNKVWQSQSTLSATEAEHKQVTEELAALSTQHGFKICQNCGTIAV